LNSFSQSLHNKRKDVNRLGGWGRERRKCREKDGEREKKSTHGHTLEHTTHDNIVCHGQKTLMSLDEKDYIYAFFKYKNKIGLNFEI